GIIWHVAITYYGQFVFLYQIIKYILQNDIIIKFYYNIILDPSLAVSNSLESKMNSRDALVANSKSICLLSFMLENKGRFKNNLFKFRISLIATLDPENVKTVNVAIPMYMFWFSFIRTSLLSRNLKIPIKIKQEYISNEFGEYCTWLMPFPSANGDKTPYEGWKGRKNKNWDKKPLTPIDFWSKRQRTEKSFSDEFIVYLVDDTTKPLLGLCNIVLNGIILEQSHYMEDILNLFGYLRGTSATSGYTFTIGGVALATTEVDIKGDGIEAHGTLVVAYEILAIQGFVNPIESIGELGF
ncbi:hypothetical protein ACJX0J_012795, partial [Zea mays]